MPIKSDFDTILDWSRATDPTDPPGKRRALIAGVTRHKGSLTTEWVDEVHYLDRQVHSVVGKFHGDLAPNNYNPAEGYVPPIGGSHLDYWLSLTEREEYGGCWIRITNAAQIPELGAAWVEDVRIENMSPWNKPNPPANADLISSFEARVDPSSDTYLRLDLSGHFVPV